MNSKRDTHGWICRGQAGHHDGAMAGLLVKNTGNIPRNIYVDFLIGMIAINHGMTVVTRNEKDFRRLGISFINPFRYRG